MPTRRRRSGERSPTACFARLLHSVPLWNSSRAQQIGREGPKEEPESLPRSPFALLQNVEREAEDDFGETATRHVQRGKPPLVKLQSAVGKERLRRSSLLQYSLPVFTNLPSPRGRIRALNSEYPTLAEFDILKTIGTGTFARVKLVRHRDSGAFLALKSLKKLEVLRLKQLQHVLNEKHILAQVSHPFIVQLRSAFQDSQRLHMLIDYVPGGELFQHLKAQPAGHFSASVARFYSASIVLALEYLHTNDIVYRDLKPENLLLDKNGYLKMTDFGFAKQICDRTWTLCGTPQYLAPEVVKNQGHGKAVDWWSAGVLLFEMLTGSPPFRAVQRKDLYELIASARYTVPDYVDPEAKDLIMKLLVVDPSMRLGNLKGGANDIKRQPFFAGVDWRALVTGRADPPIVPLIAHDGDAANFDAFAESVDDPRSPVLDVATAELVFRGF